MIFLLETGFRPALLIKQTTTYTMLGLQHNQAQKRKERNQRKDRERKRKKMPTTADRRNENDPQPLRPPETSHHDPCPSKYRVPSSTFKKDHDDDAVTARTNPRVSPGTRREVEKEYTRHPSRRCGDTRRRHRVGAGKPAGISPEPQKHNPRHTEALHQSCRPPACATTVLRSPSPSHCGQRNEAKKSSYFTARGIIHRLLEML